MRTSGYIFALRMRVLFLFGLFTNCVYFLIVFMLEVLLPSYKLFQVVCIRSFVLSAKPKIANLTSLSTPCWYSRKSEFYTWLVDVVGEARPLNSSMWSQHAPRSMAARSKMARHPQSQECNLPPPFINIRCFRFMKQMYLDKF
jgi:hypothetical protein